jgi:hypothetical protein
MVVNLLKLDLMCWLFKGILQILYFFLS